MNLKLAHLSRPEIAIALDILAFKPANISAASLKTAMKLEKVAAAYAQRAVKAARIEIPIWRHYFETIKPGDVRTDRIFREWKEAAENLRDSVAVRAGWFSMPSLALPAKHPIPAITSPRNLVMWFSIRLAANRQARFFVLCKLCGRFAVRKRSTAAYCSSRCQKLAKVEATYKNRGADFANWLLSQPKDRWLPPRMEMRRTVRERPAAI